MQSSRSESYIFLSGGKVHRLFEYIHEVINIKEDKLLKHRHRKMKKHFTIIVNDQKVKILKFKKDSVQDCFTSEEIFTIELITKMDSPVFGQKEVVLGHRKVKIEIEDEPTIIGTFVHHFSQPGLHRYKYRIVSGSDVR